jgi:hypothetical protein
MGPARGAGPFLMTLSDGLGCIWLPSAHLAVGNQDRERITWLARNGERH